MKILTLIQCANLGGMEQSTLLLLEELKQMGHEVELVSLNQVGALEPLLRQHEISASAIGYHGRWGWRSFLPLRRALRNKSADALIMVGHNLMAMLALGDFCQQRRILYLHFHHEGVKSKWGWWLIYRVAMWRFNRIIYPSHFIMDEARRLIPELAAAKRTISYPIPTPIRLPVKTRLEQRLAARKEFSLEPGHRVVGNAGWLIPRKRWDVFLQVAAQVVAIVPEARFVIAGDGPERPGLERLAADLKIQDRVVWLGWQDNLERFYRMLDVMLFNSDWDAMGRTPLEAMSYGVPVVASMLHGGLKEILDSAECGFLTDTHNIPVLAGEVVKILQNPGLGARIGANARQQIERVGSPKLHAERVLKLLPQD